VCSFDSVTYPKELHPRAAFFQALFSSADSASSPRPSIPVPPTLVVQGSNIVFISGNSFSNKTKVYGLNEIPEKEAKQILLRLAKRSSVEHSGPLAVLKKTGTASNSNTVSLIHTLSELQIAMTAAVTLGTGGDGQSIVIQVSKGGIR